MGNIKKVLPNKNKLKTSIDVFMGNLISFKDSIRNDSNFEFEKYKVFSNIFKNITEEVGDNGLDESDYSELRTLFKERFFPHALESNFGKRAIQWPEGYPGDHITLEYLYKGFPDSESLFGKYVDLYLVSRHLGVGVRERKNMLSKIIEDYIFSNDCKTILNIGCGSCRELYDIGIKLNSFDGEISCLDFDENALDFSKKTLVSRSIDIDNISFVKMNVLKLTNSTFMRNNLGSFDLIYSAGLFDYIQDKGLKRIFNSLYENLNEGGMIIAPFKDINEYDVFDYHWLANWDAFFLRTKDEVTSLINESINQTSMEILPSSSRAINFYIIKK